ncbi:MAG: thioredoxin domain-containing protein [Elusimicrobiota bacterium]
MRFITSLLSVSLLATGGFCAEEVSTEAVRKILKENPDIVLDVLKEHTGDLAEIVDQGRREAKSRKELKTLDDAFKRPKSPAITDATRVRGDREAKYTLVEYSDFQCPYCTRGFNTVQTLREKHGEDLRFVYKHLPLNFHKQAMPAALYMEAVSLQSPEKAWEFHDILFKNQKNLNEGFFKQTVEKLGLDLERIEADIKSPKLKALIKADMDEARRFGFTGTPAFLLNGIPIKGARPPQYFESIMKRLEKTAGD